MNNDVFESNHTTGGGGGGSVAAGGAGEGGGLYVRPGAVTLNAATIRQRYCRGGSGYTFEGEGLGGGIFNGGTCHGHRLHHRQQLGRALTCGGIDNVGTLTVTNSTIADNRAGGGIRTIGTLTVTNSTIADNSAPSAAAASPTLAR